MHGCDLLLSLHSSVYWGAYVHSSTAPSTPAARFTQLWWSTWFQFGKLWPLSPHTKETGFKHLVCVCVCVLLGGLEKDIGEQSCQPLHFGRDLLHPSASYYAVTLRLKSWHPSRFLHTDQSVTKFRRRRCRFLVLNSPVLCYQVIWNEIVLKNWELMKLSLKELRIHKCSLKKKKKKMREATCSTLRIQVLHSQ